MGARRLALGALLLAGACAPRPRLHPSDGRVAEALRAALPGAEAREIRPGLAYARRLSTGPAGPAAAHVLALDLLDETLALRPILAGGAVAGGEETRETLAAMAAREGALAAVNADYFGPAAHAEGLTVVDGEILARPRPPGRAALVVGRENEVWIGVFDPGKHPDLDYFQAVGGGPMLMESGVFAWRRDAEGRLNGEAFDLPEGAWESRSALTAACQPGDRTMLYLVVVEGPRGGDPSPGSAGMTPWELGDLLAGLGCEDAIRFDGGRSSGMVVGGKAVYPPAHPIGEALAVFELPEESLVPASGLAAEPLEGEDALRPDEAEFAEGD